MPNESPTSLAPLRLEEATELGTMIRTRRREQLLRIDDAATLCGVSVDLLSRLENGRGSVRLDKLLAVLDGLGLALVISPKEHSWLHSVPSSSPQPPEKP